MSTQRLFIVDREHRELYDRAARAFGANPNVHVVYDRRQHERRTTRSAFAVERRRGDRRRRPHADAELRAFGSAVVRLD